VDEKDDYPLELVSKIQLGEDDTVFDIGCGNGTITIPLAKKAKSVTALDSSMNMLEILQKKAAVEKLSNIKLSIKGLKMLKPLKSAPTML